jgi:leucyl-tRNA---protein transferase
MKHPDTNLRPSAECRLIIIQDQLQPCPYLSHTVARMPLRLPIGKLSGDMTDSLLALGYRRSGDFVYRTQCPQCVACEPTRVLVDEFRWTTSMRRVLKRGDANLRVEIGPVKSDPSRIQLFNLHRQLRHLARDEEPVDEEGYRSFLVESCCDTFELSFWLGPKLAAVSVVDQGTQSLSAVYTYFDPALSKFSLGTYSILKQFEQAQQLQLKYVYLGMYVAENKHLNYKARFMPQQRFIAGQWHGFRDQSDSVEGE